VKHREWSRRSPRNTNLGMGARLGPIHSEFALIRPRAGAAVSGMVALSWKDQERSVPRTLVRALYLGRSGRTGLVHAPLKFLRPRTRAAQSGG
jgi:hypothetical protein